MNSLNLAIYLEKESKNNPEVHRLIETAIEKIEENLELEKNSNASKKSYRQLKMDVFTLGQMRDKFKESEAIRVNNYEKTRNVFLASMQNRLNFENLKLHKINQFEILKVQMKMKEELDEVKQEMEEKQEMYDEMNKRAIVQRVRDKESEYLYLREEINEFGRVFAIKESGVHKKMQNAINKRNEAVIELVNSLKKVQDMQIKVGQHKNSQMTKQQTLSTKSDSVALHEENTEAAPNKLNMLKKLQNEVTKFPTLLEEIMRNSIKKRIEKKDDELKSILRTEQTQTKDGKKSPKSVQIMTTENSSSSNHSYTDDIYYGNNDENNGEDDADGGIKSEDEKSVSSVKINRQATCLPVQQQTNNQESEIVVENDDNYGDNESVLPAQKTTSTIDLISPSAISKTLSKDMGAIKSNKSGDLKKVDKDLMDRVDSEIELSNTSSNMQDSTMNMFFNNDQIVGMEDGTMDTTNLTEMALQFGHADDDPPTNKPLNLNQFYEELNFDMNSEAGGNNPDNSFSKYFD